MPRISAANLAAHRDQTRARLLDAFEVAVEEEGFADLTLASVAERAGPWGLHGFTELLVLTAPPRG